MIDLILFGAGGRMGEALESAVSASSDFRIKSRVGSSTAAVGSGKSAPNSEPAAEARRGDVVIDFSSPEGCVAAARLCMESGAALVSGTTGLGPAEEAVVAQASRKVAVLRAANFSLGMMALRDAVSAALKAAPPEWDVEIVERHHRRKVDSPSGTALWLARAIADADNRRGSNLRHGREGRVGPRPANEIGVHAVRGGSWVGTHSILLAGEGEWLELSHVAQDRSAFAMGALAAARFVAQAPPGVYTLDDLVHRKH